MHYFDELNTYLSNIITDYRREKVIAVCDALIASGVYQLQTDVDDLIAMSSVGEADAVLDDLYKILYGHLYRITLQMGFVWNEDVNYQEDLTELMDLFLATHLLDDIEDYGYLTEVLNHYSPVAEKVADIYTDLACKDMSWIIDKTDDIHDTVLTLIQQAIILKEHQNKPISSEHDYILLRLKRYYPILQHTVVQDHITAGGVMGGEVESLFQLYNAELVALGQEEHPTRHTITFLISTIVGLVLLSQVIDEQIEPTCQQYLDRYLNPTDLLSAGPILKEILA